MNAHHLMEMLDRIGAEHFGKRFRSQLDQEAARLSRTGISFSMEESALGPLVLQSALKACGLYRRATRNSIDYRLVNVQTSLPKLPPEFEGYRILHLSDLHLEGIVDEGEQLKETLRSLDFDVCVITGDFRFSTYGHYGNAVRRMEGLMDVLSCPQGIFGILGNHDCIEMVPSLESMGIKILLNEAVPIEREGKTVWMVGVDDTHFYQTCDLEKALEGLPSTDPKILLAHSPEIVERAASSDVDFYLCGHSHGGQICLPGSVPIFGNIRNKRKFLAGKWEHQGMTGYTSSGTGASGLSVRLSCQPEITLHHLTSGVLEEENRLPGKGEMARISNLL
jgi:predicted MPP superfamily phosphohydrolase